jgi:hypothetical protein
VPADDEVAFWLQGQHFVANPDLECRVDKCRSPKGNLLEVAVGLQRVQAHPLELSRHVSGGHVESPCARLTPLQQVVREEPHMAPNPAGGDGIGTATRC